MTAYDWCSAFVLVPSLCFVVPKDNYLQFGSVRVPMFIWFGHKGAHCWDGQGGTIAMEGTVLGTINDVICVGIDEGLFLLKIGSFVFVGRVQSLGVWVHQVMGGYIAGTPDHCRCG